MGTKATYTDSRSGNRCTTPTFGSRTIAETYVRNLKGAKDIQFVDTDVTACSTVTAVDAGTAEKQRAATSLHYRGIRQANELAIGNRPKEAPPSREQEAELDMETYGAAYAATGSSAAAMDELNYVRGNR